MCFLLRSGSRTSSPSVYYMLARTSPDITRLHARGNLTHNQLYHTRFTTVYSREHALDSVLRNKIFYHIHPAVYVAAKYLDQNAVQHITFFLKLYTKQQSWSPLHPSTRNWRRRKKKMASLSAEKNLSGQRLSTRGQGYETSAIQQPG